eukprot:Nk52_evm41s1073 gene=Nk52_evmTU41s1073
MDDMSNSAGAGNGIMQGLTEQQSAPNLMERNVVIPFEELGLATQEIVSHYPVEVRVNRMKGRGMYAKQAIRTGDVVFVDAPIYRFYDPPTASTLCDFCGHHSLNSKSCAECKCCFYCSQQCMEAAWKLYHEYECGAVALVWKEYSSGGKEQKGKMLLNIIRLISLVENAELRRQKLEEMGERQVAVFGYKELDSLFCVSLQDLAKSKYSPDWMEGVPIFRQELFSVLKDNNAKLADEEAHMLQNEYIERAILVKELLERGQRDAIERCSGVSSDIVPASHLCVDDICNFMRIFPANALAMGEERFYGSMGRPCHGKALFGGFSLLNHSCEPNCFRPQWGNVSRGVSVSADGYSVSALQGKVPLIAKRNIMPGEEITISYLSPSVDLLEDRQKELREVYGFRCSCVKCVHGIRELALKMCGVWAHCDAESVERLKCLDLVQSQEIFKAIENALSVKADDRSLVALLKHSHVQGIRTEVEEIKQCCEEHFQYLIAEGVTKDVPLPLRYAAMVDAWGRMAGTCKLIDKEFLKCSELMASQARSLVVPVEEAFIFNLHTCVGAVFHGESGLEIVPKLLELANLAFQLATMAENEIEMRFACSQNLYRSQNADTYSSPVFPRWYRGRESVVGLPLPSFVGKLIEFMERHICNNSMSADGESRSFLNFTASVGLLGSMNEDETMISNVSGEIFRNLLFPLNALPAGTKGGMPDYALGSGTHEAMTYDIFCYDEVVSRSDKNHLTLFYVSVARWLSHIGLKELARYCPEAGKYFDEHFTNGVPTIINGAPYIPFGIHSVVEFRYILFWTDGFTAKYGRNSVLFKKDWEEDMKRHLKHLESMRQMANVSENAFNAYLTVVDNVLDTLRLPKEIVMKWYSTFSRGRCASEKLPSLEDMTEILSLAGFSQSILKFCPSYYWKGFYP